MILTSNAKQTQIKVKLYEYRQQEIHLRKTLEEKHILHIQAKEDIAVDKDLNFQLKMKIEKCKKTIITKKIEAKVTVNSL